VRSWSSSSLNNFVLWLWAPAFAGATEKSYSAACCATLGSVPATVARRMSRGCDRS